jgi:hypothetical protein
MNLEPLRETEDMKHNSLLIILVLVITAGCSRTPTEPRGANTSVLGSPSPALSSSYPAPGSSYPAQPDSYDPYPAGGQMEPTPTYLPKLPTNTPDPAQDPVVIAGFTHADHLETIIIKNISSQEVNIGSWAIHASAFEGEDKFLPINLRLAPGQTYELYNGTNKNLPADQVWLKDFAFQNPADEVDLLNPAGRIIFSLTYYP